MSMGLSLFSCRMVSVTLLPGSPRSALNMSSMFSGSTVLPSIFTMVSPGLMPAREAGVSSMGAMMRSVPSTCSTSMPRPPYWPVVSSLSSAKPSLSRYSLCGSRPLSMPLMAAFIRVLLSTGST